MSVLVSEFADLGFVVETLIFKTWNLSDLIGWTDRYLQMELSNVLLFWKQWREAPGTGSPNFLISSAEMSVTVFVISLNYCSSMSEISHWGNLACLGSNTIGFIRIGFTIWDLWSFSQGDLLQDSSEQWSCTECHVSLVHLLSLIFRPPKLYSVPFL